MTRHAMPLTALLLAISVASCGKLKISLGAKKEQKQEASIGISADASGRRKLLAIPGETIDRTTYESGGGSAELDSGSKSKKSSTTKN